MPLIQIRRKFERIPDTLLERVFQGLPELAAQQLCCAEGGALAPEDIMIEVNTATYMDRNIRDLNILVFAHDYRARAARKDDIRAAIGAHVGAILGAPRFAKASWYVWLFLMSSSYGSDTSPEPEEI